MLLLLFAGRTTAGSSFTPDNRNAVGLATNNQTATGRDGGAVAVGGRAPNS